MALLVITVIFIIGLIVMIIRMGDFGLAPRIIAILSALGSGTFVWDGVGSRLREYQLVKPGDVELAPVRIERLADDPSYARIYADLKNNSEHPVRRIRIRFSIRDCPASEQASASRAAAAVAASALAARRETPESDAIATDQAEPAGELNSGRSVEASPPLDGTTIEVMALKDALPKLDGECRVIGSKVIRPDVDVPPYQVRAIQETVFYDQVPEIEGELLVTYNVVLVTARTRRDIANQIQSAARERLIRSGADY